MARRDAKRNPQRTLASRPRVLLLDRLQRESPQTAPQLAASVRLHHNTVREHLERLVDDGLVVRTAEPRSVRGRPRILFSIAEGLAGVSEPARAQTRRAIALGRAFRQAYREEAADEPDAVARQFDVIEDYLDRCGFSPRVDHEALAIRLHCPFDGLRDSLAATLCTVDRRVICSVLARVEGPLEVTGLEPTEIEGTCVLQLAQRDGPDGPELEREPGPDAAGATSCPGSPSGPRSA